MMGIAGQPVIDFDAGAPPDAGSEDGGASEGGTDVADAGVLDAGLEPVDSGSTVTDSGAEPDDSGAVVDAGQPEPEPEPESAWDLTLECRWVAEQQRFTLQLYLQNNEATPLDLTLVEVEYYYDPDGQAGSQSIAQYYYPINGTAVTTSAMPSPYATATTGAAQYVSMSFDNCMGGCTLPANQTEGTQLGEFGVVAGGDINLANDYSYLATGTAGGRENANPCDYASVFYGGEWAFGIPPNFE
jgi:hypothetical protein